MDSPAARLQRVLIGIVIPAAFLTALALAEGRIELIGCDGDACVAGCVRLVFVMNGRIGSHSSRGQHLGKPMRHQMLILDCRFQPSRVSARWLL